MIGPKTWTVGSNTRVWIDPCVVGKVAARHFPAGCPCARCTTVRLANALMAARRSLTLERDAERETAQAERTRADETFSEKLGLIARLSRAREALASWDVCLSNGAGPPAVPTPEQINRASDAVAALRAALAEPPGGP